MDKNEQHWLRWFAVIILVVTTIPYIFGFFLAGDQWVYTGFVIGVEDGNSYIAKMLSGTYGEWLFRTPYTYIPQNGFLAFFPYILLGKIVGAPEIHLQLVILFHIFRWIAGYWMIRATYLFIAFFISEIKLRKIGTAIAILGGGLGWISLVGGQGLWNGRIPLEFYSPETFGFLSLFSLPHLAAGRALLLWGLLEYWKSFQRRSTSLIRPLLVGCTWIGLGLMQPLTVLIGWMVVSIDILLRLGLSWKNKTASLRCNLVEILRKASILILPSAPLVIYTTISFTNDTFLREWSGQNLIYSPPPGDYLLAFAVLLPLLAFGFKQALKAGHIPTYTIMIWLGLFPLLAYFPYPLQRRLPEAIWVIMVIFSLFGLKKTIDGINKLAIGWALLSFLSTLVFLIGSVTVVLNVNSPLYRPKDEVQAFEYLAANAQNFPVVLAGYDTSNALPAWAPVRVVAGHGPESIRLTELKPKIDDFFSNKSQVDREEFIRDHSIRWLLIGPPERSSSHWDSSNLSNVILRFHNAKYEVYEVLP